eukprot:CAMPEP_0185801300 /NCGR_PEP_ID=MMETSP1322-20130828/1359_1 /TAXON_ID=265543 /ORGANISM="Minutocellus polymorphus, Strain RCC2270" /LENGTH=473 /DNA_ID=CAMNT_0028496989 /DNA_START=132 /DNA_END=1553 /DNA_ORIENTATION=+
MTSIGSGIAAGLTCCFGQAAMSLCGACLGNDKPSSEAPSATSGRKRSVFLLFLSLAMALVFQYAVAPALQPGSVAQGVPSIGTYLVEAWYGGCLQYETVELQTKCSGNNGVYRSAGACFVFFLIAAMAAACKPTANRIAWGAKYILFLFFVTGTVFIPNEPLFSPIFLQLSRVGGAIFIFFQQIILIDMAYNWNESWVAKADEAEQDKEGGGRKWLAGILASCAVLYLASLVGIGIMYAYYSGSGCSTNVAFITITLIAGIVCTAIQLSGEEASLLTSALITAYATYLCFTSVSKNPIAECNPKLGETDVLGIILGIIFVLVSLSWTGWSFTAAHKLGEESKPSTISRQSSLVENGQSDSDSKGEGQSKKVGGIVMNSGDEGVQKNSNETKSDDEDENGPAKTWKLNIVLGLVSCFFAMALTSWGTIESGGDAANPDVGRVSMWIIIASQWLALLLYLWTLTAPRLFPDRDFS